MTFFVNPVVLMVAMPLLSFLILGLFGRILGKRAGGAFAVILMAISTGGAWFAFYKAFVGQRMVETLVVLPWLSVGNLNLSWQLTINPLIAVMGMIVTTISFLVHLYSLGYMAADKSFCRFFSYLGLFTFMMLMLIMSGNLVQLFFGWEGVGLSSYLLIGFWHHKDSANAAAIKAFIVNRVGDIGLVLGLAALYLTFNTLEISEILNHLSEKTSLTFTVAGYSFNRLEVIALLLFLGAMGKSAQLGLHTWLPDAMEGPTPVSALIHAATMVTAGIFLLVRLSPLYELTPYARCFVLCVGATTAFFAATIALTQYDVKRVIAYSTCSQLGYMFSAIGVSAYPLAIFHLMTHAFFKALLFLGAGAVIHALSDEQDMRHMGGLWKVIPATYVMMWIGNLALAGVPFFAGYYSKEAILESVWGEDAHHLYGYMLGIITVFLTAVYAWRLLFMTFHGPQRADEKVLGHLHEPGAAMVIPMVILSMGAIFSGYWGISFFKDPLFWQSSLSFPNISENASLPNFLHSLPLLGGLLGIFLAYLFYSYKPIWSDKIKEHFKKLHGFLSHQWYFNELYEKVFESPIQKMGHIFWVKGDQGTIDAYGPDGIARILMGGAGRLSRIQSGYIPHYAFGFVVGLVLLGAIFLFL